MPKRVSSSVRPKRPAAARGKKKPAAAASGLGAALRGLRQERGLSLRALAAEAGVSFSMLSDIERGKVNPSVATMFRVAAALGVPPHTFFPAPSEISESESSRDKSPRVVLRPPQRPELPLTGGITWQRLTPRSEGPVEFIEMRYEPGAVSGDAPHHHPGREMGLVLEGELTLELGPDQYVLRAGDSIAFDSTTPHRLANRGPDVLRLAWVNVHCRTA